MHTLGHAEKVQEYGGAQAPSCEETNILLLSKRQASVYPTNYSWLLF
jgi:hypothetical protein